MTKEEAKHLAKVIDAYANNEPIQWLDDLDIWNDCKENEEMFFTNSPYTYRVKPKPPYVPYTYEKLINRITNYPCTFITDAEGWNYNILGFNKDFIKIHKLSVDKSVQISYKELLNYKFTDNGHICGILET